MASSKDMWDFFPQDSMCLAPMVRVGTLPYRLLALKYGAEAVWGEEIIDRKICACTRVENKALHTIDYLANDGHGVVFRTCAEEKSKLLYQIGTANAVSALQAGQAVEKDVGAIDINMGCPKHFSVAGGMGAALLTNPKVATDIIKTLRRNLTVPVTCKIRLLPTDAETIDLVKLLEGAGAQTITVHCRERHERSEPAHWDRLAPLVQAVSVPVLANGDVWSRQHAADVIKMSGCRGVMSARGALHNCSIFRREGKLPVDDVMQDYLRLCVKTDNVDANTKYNVMRIMTTRDEHKAYSTQQYSVPYDSVSSLKATRDIMALWGLEDFHDTERAHQQKSLVKVMAAAVSVMNKQTKRPQLKSNGQPVDMCLVCNVPLLSEQDRVLHEKGKKHRKKVKRSQNLHILSSATAISNGNKLTENGSNAKIVTNTEKGDTSKESSPETKRMRVE